MKTYNENNTYSRQVFLNLVYTTLNLFTQLNTKYKVIKPDTCNSGRAGMTSTAYMCFPI